MVPSWVGVDRDGSSPEYVEPEGVKDSWVLCDVSIGAVSPLKKVKVIPPRMRLARISNTPKRTNVLFENNWRIFSIGMRSLPGYGEGVEEGAGVSVGSGVSVGGAGGVSVGVGVSTTAGVWVGVGVLMGAPGVNVSVEVAPTPGVKVGVEVDVAKIRVPVGVAVPVAVGVQVGVYMTLKQVSYTAVAVTA